MPGSGWERRQADLRKFLEVRDSHAAAGERRCTVTPASVIAGDRGTHRRRTTANSGQGAQQRRGSSVDIRFGRATAQAQSHRAPRRTSIDPHCSEDAAGRFVIGVAGRSGGRGHFRCRRQHARPVVAFEAHVQRVGEDVGAVAGTNRRRMLRRRRGKIRT